MIIGVLQVELAIDEPTSLKDKRRVVNSVKDRLHRDHQVSVAEVGAQENMRLAVLGIAMAASDATYCRGVLDKIATKLRVGRGYVLADHRVELIQGH